MSGRRSKWLRRIWRVTCTQHPMLIGERGVVTKRVELLRIRLWKCIKKAYRPGMSPKTVVAEALKL